MGRRGHHQAARCRQCSPAALKGLTLGALFGLLASSGLRVGEALGLATGDVDLGSSLLTIRDAKFGRETLRPPPPDHDRGAPPLRQAAQRPGGRGAKAFFVLGMKGPVCYSSVYFAFGTSLLNSACARLRCARESTT